jgi:hypothetical protein
VLRLKRIAIGSLRLGNLGPGEYRPLGTEEVRELKESARSASKHLRATKPDDQPLAVNERAARRKPPDHTAVLPDVPRGNAVVRRQLDLPEKPGPQESDDDASWQPPRRPGIIIGAEASETEAPSTVKRSALSIKPIIDVRRGIFPGRNSDDFDDDELDDSPPPPPLKNPKASKRPRRGAQPRFKKAAPRPTDRPQGDRGSNRARRRKGRRR